METAGSRLENIGTNMALKKVELLLVMKLVHSSAPMKEESVIVHLVLYSLERSMTLLTNREENKPHLNKLFSGVSLRLNQSTVK